MPAALLSSAPTFALPGVWRADAWAPGHGPVIASGHAELDAELPGGGWPTGELIDLLQNPAGRHEWRLLLPALRTAQRHGPLVLVGTPHPPHLAALAAQGLAAERVLWVDAAVASERLWAAEQVLRSGTAGALLVWLPEARPESLRRLHLAARATTKGTATGTATAAQAGPLLLALRPEGVRQQASPAPLRLWLGSVQGRLQVLVFKRPGPPMEQPLALAAPLPVMACLRHWPPRPAAPVVVAPAPAHVVDRPVARAPHPQHAVA